MSVANQLRALLEAEAEGAVFHASLKAAPMPSMGGGMGIIATARLGAGTRIGCLPFRSIITVKKAALNLALAEIALEASQGASAAKSSTQVRFRHDRIPFTMLPWSKQDLAEVFEEGCTAAGTAALREKLSYLQRTLNATDTMTCYLLLMASLFGRWEAPAEKNARTTSHLNRAGEKVSASQHNHKGSDNANVHLHSDGHQGEAAPDPPTQRPLLRFSHPNRWLSLWILTLPAGCDNLLELGIRGGCPSLPTAAAAVMDTPTQPITQTEERVVKHCLSFPRHQAKVVREHQVVWKRYEHCLRTLACLRIMPRGALVREDGEEDSEDAVGVTKPSTHAWSVPSVCTLEQFLWALNNLMSRGFSFSEDVWAMMPYVDYFNYALDANGTMTYRRTDEQLSAKRRKGGTSSLTKLSSSAVASHSATNSSGWQFNGSYEYVFTTTRSILPGEQVLLHYGAYSDYELLMWYGFTVSPFLRPTLPKHLLESCGGTKIATPLSIGIRYLQHDEGRRTLFQLHHEQQIHANNAVVSGDVDLDTEEEMWLTALQRTYCHVFTPLADSDGDYPAPAEGHSWVGDLVADFLHSFNELHGHEERTGRNSATPASGYPDADSRKGNSQEDVEKRKRVEEWALFFAYDWRTYADARTRLMVMHGIASAEGGPAALGVLGPSWKMATALRLLGSHSVYAAYLAKTGEGDMSRTTVDERVWALRALAWMELASSRTEGFSFSETAAADGHTQCGAAVWTSSSAVVVSDVAVAMAKRLSTDMAGLLHYLAVEATDSELHDYIKYRGDF